MFADDVKEYGIHSDQFLGENIVRFNQTIHCPVDDMEAVITKASFVVQAILFDGTYIAIGSSSILCSSMEQPTTKSIVLHNKLEAYVGRLTVTIFHNLTPLELNEGEVLTKHNSYSPNLKEYAFLLSRRHHRKPGSEHAHPISFNSKLEESVNATVSDTFKIKQYLAGNQTQSTKIKTKPPLNSGTRKPAVTSSNTMTKRVASGSRNHITGSHAHVYTSQIYASQNRVNNPPVFHLNSPAVHNIAPPKPKPTSPYAQKIKKPVSMSAKSGSGLRRERSAPLTRPTHMSVGYAPSAHRWPDDSTAQVQHEKHMYSLFLAEERRLALLKEVNEEVKFKNKQVRDVVWCCGLIEKQYVLCVVRKLC